jgi:hypothetical protein
MFLGRLQPNKGACRQRRLVSPDSSTAAGAQRLNNRKGCQRATHYFSTQGRAREWSGTGTGTTASSSSCIFEDETEALLELDAAAELAPAPAPAPAAPLVPAGFPLFGMKKEFISLKLLTGAKLAN